MNSLRLILALALSLVFVQCVTTPEYETTYEIGKPKNQGERTCAAHCYTANRQCAKTCLKCQEDSEIQFNRELSYCRSEESSGDWKRCPTFRIECAEMCNCRNEQAACLKICGVEVKETTKCIANCDQIKK